MDIWTMKDDRTCDNVAATLAAISPSRPGMKTTAIDWPRSCGTPRSGGVAGRYEDRVFLTELYFEHDPATKLFADEFGC